jgi:hypothetical protein
MTFLSQQSFDPNGEIRVVKKKRKILESVTSTEGGVLKGQAKVKFEYGILTSDNLVKVGNIRAAEAMVLTEGEVFWGMSTPPLNHVPDEAKFAHRVSMAAANIGNMSGRGTGNTVVCHPSAAAKVDDMWHQLKTVQEFDPVTEDMMDVEKPYFPNGPLTVIEHDLAPEDSVLVLYRGEDDTDQPLIYVDIWDGLLLNGQAADVETYGKFVRIP